MGMKQSYALNKQILNKVKGKDLEAGMLIYILCS